MKFTPLRHDESISLQKKLYSFYMYIINTSTKNEN